MTFQSLTNQQFKHTDVPSGFVCAIRPHMTSGQIIAALKLGENSHHSYSINLFFDGQKLVFHSRRHTLVITAFDILGPNVPFKATFLIYGSRYRKESQRPIIALRGDTTIAMHNLSNVPTLLANAARPTVDYGPIHRVAYELKVPYKHLRSLVQKEHSIIVSFKKEGFGFYSMDHKPIDFPGKIGDLQYHSDSIMPRVIHITKKDVLHHLTRVGARGKELVSIGAAKAPGKWESETYGYMPVIGRSIGVNCKGFWSRTWLGDTNVVRHRISSLEDEERKIEYEIAEHYYEFKSYVLPEMFDVITNTKRFTPNFGDMKIGDWTIPVDEETEMTEDEKKMMRACWHAFIAQKTRLGEEIPPEYIEVAEKYGLS